MLQIKEQTYEEKVAMYEKCSKEELIKMLIACNDTLKKMQDKLNSLGVFTYDELK